MSTVRTRRPSQEVRLQYRKYVGPTIVRVNVR
jgi:hypothetical protein